MTYSWNDIVGIVRQRQMADAPLLRKMIEIKERYNGDWVLPYVTQDDAPQLPPVTPTLIAEGVDFTAMRAASVMPYVSSPAIDSSKDMGTRSVEYANIRRRALVATYSKSKLNIGLRRAFRHLAGYATAAILVEPDYKKGRPVVRIKDPLTCYPEPRAPEDLDPPTNCAFVYGMSSQSLRKRFPAVRSIIPDPADAAGGGDLEMWDVVDWWDEEQQIIGLLGPRNWMDENGMPFTVGANIFATSMLLAQAPNKAGICPAIVPRRVTLDRIVSQIGNMIGTTDLMAQLTALNIMATEKAIFPDRYIIGDGKATPRIVSGQWMDGRTGQVNILENVKDVGETKSTPDPQNQQSIDRLERAYRTSVGLVPQAGGETYGALRTGRGMDSMMGVAVDSRVQELQEIMQSELPHVNEAIIETYKGYWGSKKYSLHSGWPGDRGMVEFTPDKHLETCETTVNYAIPGTDVQGVTIQLGQLLGTGAISLHTFRTRHPYIDDPEQERELVDMEKLQQAALEGLAQHISQGAVPVTYATKVYEHLKTKPLLAAIMAADEELKAEQAKTAPPPAEGQHSPPEQMPGLAPPGAAPTPPAPPEAGPPGQLPPDMQGTMPGDIGPRPNQAGLHRLMLALSQNPPSAPAEANPSAPAPV